MVTEHTENKGIVTLTTQLSVKFIISLNLPTVILFFSLGVFTKRI